MKDENIVVVIPAYNEAEAIDKVVNEIPKFVNRIIVVDNNSSDATASIAERAGAQVLIESQRGYGYACLRALKFVSSLIEKPDIVVFLDGDYSDYPEEMPKLVRPILDQDQDFVLGARVKSLREKGAMTPQQIFGNALATKLMRWFFKSRFTDLGPFRAIKYDRLIELEMEDKTYGWTVEMQLKVLKKKWNYLEVPVRYKNRIGVSKVSGTFRGTVMAGVKILGWIFKYAF